MPRLTFFTGWLFLLNIAWAWYNGILDICFGAAMCLVTTVANHGTGCRIPLLYTVDQIVVNSGIHLLYFVYIIFSMHTVGLWFLCYGWWALPMGYYLAAISLAAIVMTLYLGFSLRLNHWKAHAVVHVLANVGVGVYLAGAIQQGRAYADAWYQLPWPAMKMPD
jgi:hypothetical protein